ncbi:MAG: discoidin domain-containing protein [Candidatus Omnitrophica bacterium]|nr:discoidin domain-containing protein [Candidatus Omnitrophota bacterium]
MKKYLSFLMFSALSISLIACGCSPKAPSGPEKEFVGPVPAGTKDLEFAKTTANDPLYYLKVSAAKASSFDTTPDWAPEPNPMAPVDGDILTRWSSNYEGSSEWIYFDLGKRSAVSDVIVRWERACAKKYKIQVSNDAETWRTVYNEVENRGGAKEASFPAVLARYVRVQCVEKADEDWGISIWEVEIYGPKSLNPGVAVSKDDYTSKGKEEGMKKQAEDLVSSLAGPVKSIQERSFQSGVVYTSWTSDELLNPASDITLAGIKKKGFDTVAIMVPAYQDEISSEKVFTNDYDGGDTPNEKSLKHAIETCHKLGLRVMLKPHVDPRTNEARINIIASEKWFDSYDAFIIRYAKLAAAGNVEIFSIGTELEATTFSAWDKRWRGVIAKAREVYKGTITYSANWTEYKEVPFWDVLDLIGIDAYFPLSEKDDPSAEELSAAWEKHAAEIEAWLNEKGLAAKGVILSEIGYTSSDGTGRQPWAAISAREDQAEQADCLNAVFEVLSKKEWFKGFYIWQYMPQERWSPLGFTIDKKKAEEVVKKWLDVFVAKK